MAKVLIMDDSIMMRAVLKNYVSSENHEIIEAKDGDEAIEKYKAERPALSFLDIIIPGGKDGLTALKEIKDFDPSAKVVIVSSLKEQTDIDKAKSLGVVGYITKPYSEAQIKEVIHNNL